MVRTKNENECRRVMTEDYEYEYEVVIHSYASIMNQLNWRRHSYNSPSLDIHLESRLLQRTFLVITHFLSCFSNPLLLPLMCTSWLHLQASLHNFTVSHLLSIQKPFEYFQLFALSFSLSLSLSTHTTIHTNEEFIRINLERDTLIYRKREWVAEVKGLKRKQRQ